VVCRFFALVGRAYAQGQALCPLMQEPQGGADAKTAERMESALLF